MQKGTARVHGNVSGVRGNMCWVHNDLSRVRRDTCRLLRSVCSTRLNEECVQKRRSDVKRVVSVARGHQKPGWLAQFRLRLIFESQFGVSVRGLVQPWAS